MKSGNPAKPRHIKEAQGTLKKYREIENPVMGEVMSVLPVIPEGFNKDEEKYFIHRCEQMLNMGLLTPEFVQSMERAAVWYGIWITTRRAIKKNGYTQTTQSGYSAITSDLTTMEKAHKYLVDFEREYGFTLASSQKISMPPKDKGNEYFD